ncbi:MAG: hypothetical protein NTY48_06285 [Candidatus Diapherotrites archaeon]|nr:hypothetical protein [Candidatus Diapherotrites archaeon]
MKIGIDIDEVLFGYVEAYCKFYNETHKTKFSPNEFHSYSFWEIVGGTREDILKSVHEFHKTKHFLETKPVEGSICAIKNIKKGNVLFLVSSRQDNLFDDTTKWILEHFPKTFSGLYLTNYFTNDASCRTKNEISVKLGLDILIEDQPHYALECASDKCTVILLDKPWNKNFNAKNVIRAKDWKEAEKIIGTLPKS